MSGVPRSARSFGLGFLAGLVVAVLVMQLRGDDDGASPAGDGVADADATPDSGPAAAGGDARGTSPASPRRRRARASSAEETRGSESVADEVMVDAVVESEIEWVQEDEPEASTPAPAQAVAAFEALLARSGQDAGAADTRDARTLLASPSGEDALRAVAVAVRRGNTDVLLSAAGPSESTPVRRAAIVGLAHVPWEDRSAESLRAAWAGGDDDIRAAVLGALTVMPGDAASALAWELLRRGDASAEEVGHLASVALRNGNVAAMIRGAPDAETALALAVGLRDVEGWNDRATGDEGDPVGDAIHPWLRGPGLADERAAAALYYPLARRWPRFADVAADPQIVGSVRATMLVQAVEMEDVETATWEAAAGAFLLDRSVRAAEVAQFLGALSPDHLAVPSVRSALESLADEPRDSARREAARQALQRLRPGETGDLQIVRAEYGDGDTWRDVTPAVRSLCARGRLAMQVMNEIDGDPLVGVVKTLRVEYVHRGRSFTVSASEYAWIRIP